ncbi:hypothetical protein NC651_038825 [Populus alba x Populus x berolinensis]|nr:hypothetical protein NC651_038825 [Populus alba x Populus x berolinensis]
MSSNTPSPAYKTIHVNTSFTRKENLEQSDSWNLARNQSVHLKHELNSPCYLLEILPCKGIS